MTVTPEPQAKRSKTRRDAEVFVHLRLETLQSAAWLGDPDVAQAAQTALASRARLYRCRVFALGGGADHLHVVFSFPPSMPLNQLIRQLRQAAGQAVVRGLLIRGVPDVLPEAVWSGRYQMDSVSECDLAGLVAYIGQHPGIHTGGLDWPQQECPPVPEAGTRPAWRYIVRERSQRYQAR